MKEVYIADYLRLPIGKQNGLYKKIIPENFTSYLLRGLIDRNPLLEQFADLLILANAVSTGGNMARHIGFAAGLPATTPAYSIDSQCVGSYQSIISGFNAIKAAEADLVIVGGFESSSLRPPRYYHENDERFSQQPYFYADFVPRSAGDSSLVKAANRLTIKHGFDKNALVEWAILSNQRAIEAQNTQTLRALVHAFEGNYADENFKSVETLQRFKQKEKLVDASTSCMLDDGAAVLVLASEQGLHKLGLGKVAKFKIVSCRSVGGAPDTAPEVFLAAIDEIMKRIELIISDIDLFEINESFALKPLLFKKRFKVETDRINLLGGNLAYGHPFGASGAINVMHLLGALEVSQKEFGLTAASAAGGLGSALVVQQL